MRVRASLKGVEVDLQLDDSGAQPASACADLGNARFDFTQKRVSLRARGTVRHGGRTMQVENGLAGLDFTHGYLRRETRWRWAFGMGEAAGHQVAFNFSEGFLPGDLSENVVWIDGVPQSIGPVAFQFDASTPSAPWLIRARSGAAALEFAPEGQRAQKVWTPLMSSAYVQPFGSFRGTLQLASGETLAIEKLAGVTEDHAAVW